MRDNWEPKPASVFLRFFLPGRGGQHRPLPDGPASPSPSPAALGLGRLLASLLGCVALALPCPCLRVRRGSSTLNPAGCSWGRTACTGPAEQHWNCRREDLGLAFAFWINLGKGGDLFCFLTCLPVISTKKFGCVPRFPWQLLNAERNRTPKACEPSRHSFYPHEQLWCAWCWASQCSVHSVAVLALLLREVGRKLLCFGVGPLWDVLVSTACKDPFPPSSANPNPWKHLSAGMID